MKTASKNITNEMPRDLARFQPNSFRRQFQRRPTSNPPNRYTTSEVLTSSENIREKAQLPQMAVQCRKSRLPFSPLANVCDCNSLRRAISKLFPVVSVTVAKVKSLPPSRFRGTVSGRQLGGKPIATGCDVLIPVAVAFSTELSRAQ